MNYHSIAIDGPSGAGKSTLAKMLAKKLNYIYVDTGAIYRTVAVYVLDHGISPDDGEQVSALLPEISIRMGYDDAGLQRMYLNGTDVTDRIRDHEVSAAASKVSAIPAVRSFLLEMQRETARCHNVIMDGRDIGTVVLPQADLKIFLTADVEDRAERRYQELRKRGQNVEFSQILLDQKERDERDENRSAAPLRQAEDAVLVDTTGNSVEDSFRLLLEMVRSSLKQ